MELPSGVLRWVAACAGAPVDSVAELPGATSSAIHAVLLSTGRQLVLRRYTNADWLAREPDLAEHEASVLALLAGAGIPVPELVGVDRDGAHCGAPAVLTTRLPGLPVRDADRGRMAAAAEQAVAIHAVTPPARWLFARYNPEPGPPPPWSDRPELWEAAFAAAGVPRTGPGRFIHRDYHYGNVLWDRGELSGVIDWVNGCAGPPGIDVARFRLNLALDVGIAAADAFRTAYERAAGSAHDPHWDIVDAVDMLPYYEGWAAVAAWPDGAWPVVARDRLETFLARTLADLG